MLACSCAAAAQACRRDPLPLDEVALVASAANNASADAPLYKLQSFP